MADYIVEKVLDILIDARNRNLTMGSILHSDCRYFASTLVKNDVVPVVRCKDCKHYQESTQAKGFYRCKYSSTYEHDVLVLPNDFCNYGERKNDNG